MDLDIHIEELVKRSAVDVLARFDKICFAKDGMSKSDWEAALSLNSYACCAIDQVGTVGVAVAKFGAGIGYLYSSAILPEYRRKGFGKALTEHRIDVLSKIGCHKIQAHTRLDNEASEAMLISCGFGAIQYVTDYYDDFEDAVLWERAI